jgi:hypothetical protein
MAFGGRIMSQRCHTGTVTLGTIPVELALCSIYFNALSTSHTANVHLAVRNPDESGSNNQDQYFLWALPLSPAGNPGAITHFDEIVFSRGEVIYAQAYFPASLSASNVCQIGIFGREIIS